MVNGFKFVYGLYGFQSDCVDALRMECSEEDIKNNPEARQLAKRINKQGKRIDKIIKLYRKMFR